jgi:hypothetical protein
MAARPNEMFTPVALLHHPLPALVRSYMIIFDIPVWVRVIANAKDAPRGDAYFTDDLFLLSVLKPRSVRATPFHQLQRVQPFLTEGSVYTGLSVRNLFFGIGLAQRTKLEKLWNLTKRGRRVSLLSLTVLHAFFIETVSSAYDLVYLSDMSFDIWWANQEPVAFLHGFTAGTLGMMMYWVHGNAIDEPDSMMIRGCLWIHKAESYLAHQRAALVHGENYIRAWYDDSRRKKQYEKFHHLTHAGSGDAAC